MSEVKKIEQDSTIVKKINSTVDAGFANYDYYKPLEKEEMEKFKLYAVTKDPVIREQLIISNMSLVSWITRKIMKKYKNYNFDFYELLQYGYEGLIKAVDNFDPSRGNSFSSYAIISIKGNVLMGIYELIGEKNRDWIASFLKYKKVIEDEKGISIENDYESIEDLVDMMIDHHVIAEKNRIAIIQRIKLLLSSSLVNEELFKDITIDDYLFHEEDLDKYVYSEDAKDSGFFESKESGLSESMAQYLMLKKDVDAILHTLTPREEKIIKLRFGFEDGVIHTLKEIGEMFNISKSRVSEIIQKSLKKLRESSQTDKLIEYKDVDFHEIINQAYGVVNSNNHFPKR